MINNKILILFTTLIAWSTWSAASFLPEDFVPRRMSFEEGETNDLTQEEFDSIIEKIETIYAPLIELQGATLRVVRNWEDDTVNAFARQMGDVWEVQMFGGLARYPLMTNDGFAMVMCHELGHHIAGYPIRPGFFGFFEWASNEGQSDYFAAQVCGPAIWEDELETNATFREDVHAVVQERCDAVWENEERQNLCYRVSAAGLSLSRTLADLNETDVPNYETPNPTVVAATNHKHPEAQCRLDTTMAGALCVAEFDTSIIPGKKAAGGVASDNAEKEAAKSSCMRIDEYEEGLRPLCWFKPRL